ncbi:MAG TPA: translation initiation factor IF-2 N-terminal domain-containing protein [Pyrinomonadaceae bacterium]|jgi:translation initiation factor IF-2
MKIRIYDLAKELKIDTKKIIEEARRLGVNISVPSNMLSPETAQKIREKFGKGNSK